MARKPAAGAVDDPVTAYAKAVNAGKLPAGPHVRGACRRHLDDLRTGAGRGLKWDVAKANRAISFFRDVLVLNGGEHEGLPFVLLPWQAFIVGSLFGWLGAGGYRRFRVAYVESGKGSGKSPLAGGIGLYMLVADKEPRAEVYAVAGTKDQAQILFRDAVAMFRLSPLLAGRLTATGGAGKEWSLADVASSSFFRTLASDTPKSGLRVHAALIDEVHEHHDGSAFNMMRAGTKGRRQALIFAITNSGSNRTSICYEYHKAGIAVCDGSQVNDAFFAYICALDEGEDPMLDESCWAKANPSLGHTFTTQYLRELVVEARGMPSKEGVVRRLNFCQWTDSISAWIDRALWDAAEADFDIDDMAGLPLTLGLDLSQKRDLTALGLCWTHPDGSHSIAAVAWTPADTLDERARIDNVPYRAWRDAGWLQAPPGLAISKPHVAQYVAELCARQTVVSLAYDQAQMDDFVEACGAVGLDVWVDDGKDTGQRAGLRLKRHGQGFAGYQSETALWMPRSIGLLEDAIMGAKVRIQRNPVLRYASASAVLESDATGNRKWNKQKSNGRIDPIVAVTMAIGAAGAPMAAPRRSIWDDPDMLAAMA